MKLSQIAEKIQGEMLGVDVEITGVSNLDDQYPDTIAYADNKKNLDKLAHTDVAALIIGLELDCVEKPCVRVKNPRLAFGAVLEIFTPYKPYPISIYPQAHIEKTAKIGKNVTIMPFAVIMDYAEVGDHCVIYPHVFIGKNVKIGKNCLLKSGVKIDDESSIGDNVIIHHNSVIGGEGFGYVQENGKNLKVPQIGKIVIEDDVEIGSCVTVDRSTIGETRIGRGVKIDNLVQVAHNVKIGENSVIVAQVGIAGSTTIGKNCILAGQVGVSDHVVIGDNVVVMAQAGVLDKKIETGSVLLGTPARDFMETKRVFSAWQKLPELLKRVKDLEKKVFDEA